MERLRTGFRRLAVLGLAMVSACDGLGFDGEFHPRTVLSAIRTLPIATLDTGVQDTFYVNDTQDPNVFLASWSRYRMVLGERPCRIAHYRNRQLDISTAELNDAMAGFFALDEFSFSPVDWSAQTQLGCLPAGRSAVYHVIGPSTFVEWVGDVPPTPVTIETLEPLGRLWDRVVREGKTHSERYSPDVPIPADEVELWPGPEWSLGR